jgi:hypothetical protein
MAITLDAATLVFSIPQADLTLVTGTLYDADTDALRQEMMALLASEPYAYLPDPYAHAVEVTVAGVTYARTLVTIGGYSYTFTPNSQWTARLVGSNNDFFDVENSILNQNQVQVIPTNSAGLQTVLSGSGLDAGQDTKLTRIYNLLDVIEGTLDHQEVMRVLLAAMAGKLSGADGLNVLIRDLADSKDRIDATVDENGNRTAVTIDAS